MNFHGDGGKTVRIPVSLKFDIYEEFYQDFIYPLRQERRLSDMVVNLLRAYYEDAEIRRLVDTRVLGQEEIDELNREIERISLEHRASILKTDALRFETDSKLGVVEFPQEKAETPIATMESILNLVKGVSKPVETGATVDNDIDFDIPDFDAMEKGVQPAKVYYSNKATQEDAAIYAEETIGVPETPPFTALEETGLDNKNSGTKVEETNNGINMGNASLGSSGITFATAPAPAEVTTKEPVSDTPKPSRRRRGVPSSLAKLSESLEG